MTQKEFYKSRSWRRCRQAFIDWRLSIDGGRCQVCGKTFGKVVHHIVWLNDDNVNDFSISLNFDNLRYECQDCHNKEIDPKSEKRKIRFAEDGKVICFGI